MTERVRRPQQGVDRKSVLMVVHAHPDDESSQTGGTLARYAAASCRAVLVTCTDGANGDAVGGAKPGQEGHDPRRVAEHRSMELDTAADALGVVDVVKLGYPDSGMPEEDGLVSAESFSARPLLPMVSQMVRLMRLYEPDVVITYPPNGLSGHPDHIRTHELVVAAHGNVVANGQSAGRVPRLYYIAMSVSRLRAAHASQPDAALLLRLFAMSDESAEPVAQVEEYQRAYPPMGSPAGVVERDFFAPQRPPRSSGTSTACS